MKGATRIPNPVIVGLVGKHLSGTDVQVILALCTRHLADLAAKRFPEEEPSAVEVLIHGHYAWVDVNWKWQGVELLLRKRDGEWQVVTSLGEWIA